MIELEYIRIYYGVCGGKLGLRGAFMRNFLKKSSRFLLLIFLFVMFLSLPGQVLANSIDSIDLEAVLHKDGSATITEHRIFNAEKGTEHYLTFDNLGLSDLVDFKVYENGKELTNIGEWNVDATLKEKAGKYGVVDEDGKFELCFGIGSLGKKDFTIEYKFSNFVRRLKDGKQAIYWYFIQPNMNPISKINIAVKNDIGFKYKYPDTKIWGFGFDGKAEIDENALLLWTDKRFRQDEYIVMLGIFPENTFDTTARSAKTEKELIDKATENSVLNEPADEAPANVAVKQNSDISDWTKILIKAGLIWFGAALFITPFVAAHEKNKKKKQYLRDHKYITKTRKGTYFRDIPYEGKVTDVGELLQAKMNHYMSTLILQWVQDGYLLPTSEMKGLIFKKEKMALVINQDKTFNSDSEAERNLWKLIVDASGKDQILSYNEFKDHVYKFENGISWWNGMINRESASSLEAQGYLTGRDVKILFIINSREYKITANGQKLLDQIYAFKNYLLDFSLLSEREVGDVRLWSQYMLWATMLGIGQRVYEQLQMVNPEIVSLLSFDLDTISNTESLSYGVYITDKHINSSKSDSSRYGGGGSTYSGGGEGAAGGSSGGGTR